MSAAACIGEPISWLLIERRALGELPAARAGAVEAHLAACPACRACLEAVATDARPLPALPAAAVAPRRRAWAWPRLAWGAALLAAAAALLLLWRRDDRPGRGGGVAIKGGDVAISLVRERGGIVTRDPTGFAPADRFKVEVTCPPADGVWVDVVVLQPDAPGEPPAAAFPLEARPLACGNRVAIPGAFRIDGDQPATICVALSRGGPASRSAVAAGEKPTGPCVTVTPDR